MLFFGDFWFDSFLSVLFVDRDDRICHRYLEMMIINSITAVFFLFLCDQISGTWELLMSEKMIECEGQSQFIRINGFTYSQGSKRTCPCTDFIRVCPVLSVRTD